MIGSPAAAIASFSTVLLLDSFAPLVDPANTSLRSFSLAAARLLGDLKMANATFSDPFFRFREGSTGRSFLWASRSDPGGEESEPSFSGF